MTTKNPNKNVARSGVSPGKSLKLAPLFRSPKRVNRQTRKVTEQQAETEGGENGENNLGKRALEKSTCL